MSLWSLTVSKLTVSLFLIGGNLYWKLVGGATPGALLERTWNTIGIVGKVLSGIYECAAGLLTGIDTCGTLASKLRRTSKGWYRWSLGQILRMHHIKL